MKYKYYKCMTYITFISPIQNTSLFPKFCKANAKNIIIEKRNILMLEYKF